VRIEFNLLRPEPPNDEPIEHRRDNRVDLGISVITESDHADLPWSCIRVSNTGSPGRSRNHSGQSSLELTLQLHGATTGHAFVSACGKCSTRASSISPNLALFDFIAKDGLVKMKGGEALVGFRFRCLPGHHRFTDTEYR
jgi:hypothetical protein